MPDFLIVANGPFCVKEILIEVAQNKQVIALDGAANKLMQLNIKPDVIFGDFDSIFDGMLYGSGLEQVVNAAKKDGTRLHYDDMAIVHNQDQNLIDLAKAIHFCDQQAASSITIVCATGGNLDHHEGNLRALRTEYRKNRLIILHTEQQTIRYARDEALVVEGQVGDRCGVLGFPYGQVSSQGLLFDMADYPLRFGFSESISNALKKQKASVQVTGEALIVMPPMLVGQRKFMQCTERERLEWLLRETEAKK